MKRRRHLFFALFLGTLFLGVSVPSLHLPGPYEDEVSLTIPAIHLLSGHPPGPFGVYPNLRLGDTFLPVLSQDYLSFLKSYVLAPFFLLGGINLETLRGATLLLGAASLAVGFLFLCRFAGARAALLGSLLLALDPSFLFHNRHDWGPVSLMFLLKLSSLYFFARWWTDQRMRDFWIASLCLGLGIFDKVNFAWFVAAAAPAFLVLWPGALRWLQFRHFAILSAFLLLGSFVYIDRNLFSEGRVLSMMRGYSEGLDAFALSRLQERAAYHLALAHSTLRGEIFFWFSTASSLSIGSLFPWLFLLSLLLWAAKDRTRKALFFLLLAAGIAACLVLTPEAGGSHHTLMLYPFPHYFVAVVLAQVLWTSTGSRWARWRQRGVWMLLAAVLASNFWVIGEHYRAYRSGRTSWKWSQDIYQLENYLWERRDRPIYLLDWGIRHNLLFLTRGRLDLPEPYWGLLLDPDFREQFEGRFPEPGALYVLHGPESTEFHAPRDRFLEMVETRPEAVKAVQAIPAGPHPTFLVYEASGSPGSRR